MPGERLLLANIDVSIRALERSMNKAGIAVERSSGRMEKRWNRMSRNIERRSERMARDVRRAIVGIGLAVAGREVVSYGDAWADMTNKIAAASEVAGLQGRSLRELQMAAGDARQTLEPYVDLYARILRSSKGVADSEEEVARATQLAAKAFKAGGASVQEQAAGILQLGQALGSGFLQGDELRSIRENAPLVAKAIADAMDVSIGELKALGAEGKLTSDIVFQALLDGAEDIEAAFAVTIPRGTDAAVIAFDRLGLEIGTYLGETNAVTNASQVMANAINWAADNVDALASALIIGSAALAGWLGAQGAVAVANGLQATATGATAAAKAMALLRAAVAFVGGPWVLAFTAAATAVAALVVHLNNTRNPVEELDERLTDVRDRLEEIAERAGTSLEAIERGAEMAAGRVNDLDDAYQKLIASMRESGALARGQAINDATVALIEARQAAADARKKIRREEIRSGGLSGGFTKTDRIEKLERAIERANDAAESAQKTIDFLLTSTTNEDFKPAPTNRRGGGSGGSKAKGPTVSELERAFEIELARAQADRARLAMLQDAAEIEKRTAEYVKAGLDATEAKAKAEAEVINLRQAAIAQEAEDIAKQARDREQAAIAERNEQALRLAEIEKQNALELARLSGNRELIAQLEREAEIERRITEYLEAGVEAAEARRRATSDTDIAIEGRERQRFRDIFAGAAEEAFRTGNVGEAIRSVFAERASEGLRQALNNLADTIFDIFKDVFKIQGEGGGFGGLGDIVNAGIDFFGGKREHGGPVAPGRFYEVNEGGKPELLKTNGKTFLMPGAAGMVQPLSSPGGRGGVSVLSPLHFHGDVTKDSLPEVRRMLAERDERLLQSLPRMIDARVADGVSKGKY